MPVYEYECPKHGRFEATNSIEHCRQDAACPACARGSRRVISAPHLALLAPATRVAHDRNEKSRHEPHVHTASCGHNHGVAKKKKTTAQVSKGRPWVLEHG